MSIIDRVVKIESRLDKMETDFHTIKNSMQVQSASISQMNKKMDSFADVADDISKIWKWIKRGLPLVATAAITSGVVNGKWGAFLSALFSGHS